MISDVLAEAIEEIERYQQDMPDLYCGPGTFGQEIDQVKAAMRRLLVKLDSPLYPEAPWPGPAHLESN
jgi:hypothetical protein